MTDWLFLLFSFKQFQKLSSGVFVNYTLIHCKAHIALVGNNKFQRLFCEVLVIVLPYEQIYFHHQHPAFHFYPIYLDYSLPKQTAMDIAMFLPAFASWTDFSFAS